MRIVHINLYDRDGGAARIAWTLMDSMTQMGHEVNIFAHHKVSDDSRVLSIPFLQTDWQQKLLEQQNREGLFDLYSTALLGVLKHPLFDQADVVHLHCINGGYFSMLLLPFLTAKPTVWTLHDPLAFTAGCLNTDFCDGWKNNWCAECPQDAGAIGRKPQRQLMQLIKSSIYKVSDFTVVCPSAWLTRQAQQSIIQEHDIRLIYNGVDIDIFKPGNQIEQRKELGLPIEKKLIMFAAHGGFNNTLKGGTFLYKALIKLYNQYPDLVLLNIGTVDYSVLKGLPIERVDIPFITDPQLLSKYYAAADIFVSSSLVENLSLTVCEALACGTPVVAFAVGGTPEIVVHKEMGYLAKRGDSNELARGIEYFLENENACQRAGVAARKRAVEMFSHRSMVDHYIHLYEEMIRKKSWAVSSEVPTIRPKNTEKFVENAKRSGGWDHVWKEFWQIYKSYRAPESQARNTFVDEFYGSCLKMSDIKEDSSILWKVIEDWPVYRYMQVRSGGLPAEEAQALLEFSYILRTKIHDYIGENLFSPMVVLEGKQQTSIINVWWHVFLNYFSVLNLQENIQGVQREYTKEILAEANENNKYERLLLASLYYPFNAEEFDIDLITLWSQSHVPSCYKVILSFWLTNIPYYSIKETQRKRLLQAGADLCKISVPPAFVDAMVNHISHSFWIASYAGGNNVAALSAFGDFIAAHMSRSLPEYSSCKVKERERPQGNKIRIGYISRFFYNQSVSYYMVNRIIHHDRNKFEVYVFALGDRHDEMTELFTKNASHFQQFKSLKNSKEIAQSIADSQLDILIYTEIGMDSFTYMLAGIQLAPVQCAMVGHGTTTGLPTIQYYISGDFEPYNAQFHYREKLIRLPNLGAAQYPPPLGSSMTSTRRDWNIPDDAIVFVSCANGLKHVPQRDMILMEILKRVPNACIALKPYSSNDGGNELGLRITAAAKEAGVENRLFIVPPLKYVGPLLSIADIQLDTYPYGGWTTNMEALYMGLPIVTQEGDMARSRWGAYMLRAIGVYEGIANSADEYVEWAVRFARDLELRQHVKGKIMRQGRENLFNGAAAQASYEEVLVKILAESNQ
ncbi:MAG: glycosyltransferase [Sporomusaceae bacterium]|nr:glycosyltransferase [Sporomusaceae bacterium]